MFPLKCIYANVMSIEHFSLALLALMFVLNGISTHTPQQANINFALPVCVCAFHFNAL